MKNSNLILFDMWNSERIGNSASHTKQILNKKRNKIEQSLGLYLL